MSEAPPSRLYKYLVPDRVDVLEHLRIRFTQAAALNDPFELMVKIDGLVPNCEYEKHLTPTRNHMEAAIKRRYQTLPRNLRRRVSERSFVTLALENPALLEQAVANAFQSSIPELNALGPQVQERLRDQMRTHLGILSLTELPTSTTQWAYYAANGAGFVIEFDTRDPWFDRRRSSSDECFHLRGVKYQDAQPKALIELDGDMFITKGRHWQHEREWRMLAPVRDCTTTLEQGGDRIHLFDVAPTALVGVVIGYAASSDTRARIRTLVESKRELQHVPVKEAHLERDTHRVVVS